LIIIAFLIAGGVTIIIQYKAMSSRLEVATNIHTAKLAVEGIVRNSSSEEDIERTIGELSTYPGFEEVTAELISKTALKPGEEIVGWVFEVSLTDNRIGRREVFSVYRYDPYAK